MNVQYTTCFGVSCFMMTLFHDYGDADNVPPLDIATLQGMYIAVGAMMMNGNPDTLTFTNFRDLYKLGQDTIVDFIHQPGMFEALNESILKIPNYVPDDL